MPSLRQRVTTYFRQLSFIAEPRDESRLSASLSPRQSANETFITKFLNGRLDSARPAPEIYSDKEPSNLPDFPVGVYETGPQAITAACTGPDDGLTCVKRSRLHLSAGPDIDFIDTNQEQDIDVYKSPSMNTLKSKHSVKLPIQRGDQNANKAKVAGEKKKPSSRKNSTHQPLESAIVGDKSTCNVLVSLVSRSPAKKIQQKTDIKYKDSLNQNPSTRQIDGNGELPDTSDAIGSIDEEHKQNVEESEPIAGVVNWKAESDYAYGLSVSLYEKNPISSEVSGSPIADCFGVIARGSSAALALADGVNWGEGARLAARSAVLGCLEYLDTAVFGLHGSAKSTQGILVSLLRSFWEAHDCILEVGGALSTLTVVVIVPLGEENSAKSVVCACNVGDSLAYVYSKTYGVREITEGSHDTTLMRDMRDALGALGPVNGNNPELENLTLSITIVEEGDIVFITSDGISDNFDPVVGKFAEALSSETLIEPRLASKRQNKSASAIHTTRHERLTAVHDSKSNNIISSAKHCGSGYTKVENNSVTASTSRHLDQAILPPRTKAAAKQISEKPNIQKNSSTRPKYMRSYTVIESRSQRNITKTLSPEPVIMFPKATSGLPLVTGVQRYKLTLLRLEDLLNYGINGTSNSCTSAKKLCLLLVDFATMITAAKRKLLEQRESYVKIVPDEHGIRREEVMNKRQQRTARRRIVESSNFQSLPGKLDHATVVAFKILDAQKPCIDITA
ncbi:PP2C-like domain-containing protein CG9801 [Phlebotomus argentipes]|uniref:PP2C-like domain-containing protein CG9801 n=1 Tax=Phlebotomus argentipes TaxID=94469 RepID=UPI002892F2BB|nr:PP2C-like domain-containing protein CG9801 [Phlebotomus argentipes]